MGKILRWLYDRGVVQFFVKKWQEHQAKVAAEKQLLEQVPKIRASNEAINGKLDELIQANKEILHYNLDHFCYGIIAKGHQTEAEYTRLTETYTAYHDIGGNSSGTKLFEQAEKMPIKNEGDFEK